MRIYGDLVNVSKVKEEKVRSSHLRHSKRVNDI